ncbi:MAG: 5'/3'-nucleotidase SurE [Gammaproteobacteria bacterium]|nr:MAG: 5'/3'-nucleotidase SurE [Gammaproteobacteria bacterium]
MFFLLSNDDGYRAPGLGCLAAALAQVGEVAVVVPDRDRSGASNSLTLDLPLRVSEMADGVLAVNGTPTDCVHLAITGLLDREPDMVVSGINAGANLGDDVLYSGTVAAAMEGRFLGYPALAVSLVGEEPGHFDTAVAVTMALIRQLRRHPLPSDTILNINVPDLPMEEISGWEATRLGYRHKAEPVIQDRDPRGRKLYWVGPPGPEQDAGPGTDFHTIRQGRVSITPLQLDLTRHDSLSTLSGWLEGIGGPG